MTLTGIRAGIFCWLISELLSWWIKVSIKARIVLLTVVFVFIRCSCCFAVILTCLTRYRPFCGQKFNYLSIIVLVLTKKIHFSQYGKNKWGLGKIA